MQGRNEGGGWKGVGERGRRWKGVRPNSTVLFDGNISTLTGLDGETWASQLLTLQTKKEARKEKVSLTSQELLALSWQR